MSNKTVKALYVGLVLGLLSVAFLFGRWSGALQGSLKAEADYPWELHRKIQKGNFSCQRLLKPPSTGLFHVETVDDGAILIIASYDSKSGAVTAFAIDSSGRIATEKWITGCK